MERSDAAYLKAMLLALKDMDVMLRGANLD